MGGRACSWCWHPRRRWPVRGQGAYRWVPCELTIAELIGCASVASHRCRRRHGIECEVTGLCNGPAKLEIPIETPLGKLRPFAAQREAQGSRRWQTHQLRLQLSSRRKVVQPSESHTQLAAIVRARRTSTDQAEGLGRQEPNHSGHEWPVGTWTDGRARRRRLCGRNTEKTGVPTLSHE